MKMVNANSNSFLDSFMKNKPAVLASKTFKDERVEAEAKAVEHEAGRKVQASKYQNVVVSNEQHPGFKAEVTDEPKITQKACTYIKDEIGKLVGKGGFQVDPKEYRTVNAHNDKIDDSKITEKALIHFALKFATPKKSKIANFVVSYDLNNHENFKLENRFYTEAEKEVFLTKENLNQYLNTENTEVKVQASKPIAYFNAEVGTYDLVNTNDDPKKVINRLASLGYEIDSSFWVDASYDPNKFGKLVHFVNVTPDRMAEFKKVVAMSDDDWFNRTDEKKADSPYKDGKQLDWFDRSLEKGGQDQSGNWSYSKEEFKDGKKWVDRALDTGKDAKANPYGGKEMYRDEMLHEAKKTETPEVKPEPTTPTLEKIAELEKLLN